MDLWKSLDGMVEVELLCADPSLALQQLTLCGITIYNVKEGNDPMVLRLQIRRRDHHILRKLAGKRGYEWELTDRGGLYWTLKAFLRRPVLVTGMILFLILSIWLPSRVLFFRVEGNSMIPSQKILDYCESAGIGFGASRRNVRSEKVKNALLEAIPQLQWVGVNTSGCVATITVKERAEEPSEEQTGGVSSIVASRDGIITSCTASKGNLLCKPGQVVTAGEVLISGYTDCGLSIQATRAEGEIFAQTSRELTAIFPAEQIIREGETRTVKKYAIIIGKKRINFYKGSGISGDTCDKMYTERYVTLPGGFQLPVIWVTESWTVYDCSKQEVAAQLADAILTESLSDYLIDNMVAGTVIKSSYTTQSSGSRYDTQGRFACLEMIGQVRKEEIIKPYGN